MIHPKRELCFSINPNMILQVLWKIISPSSYAFPSLMVIKVIVLRLRNQPITILDLMFWTQILKSEYWIKFYDKRPRSRFLLLKGLLFTSILSIESEGLNGIEPSLQKFYGHHHYLVDCDRESDYPLFEVTI